MNQSNKFSTVLLVLLSVIIGSVAIVLGIDYFEIEAGGIIEPQGEISFGVSSKLGWILTFGIFVIYLIFALLRNVYYKLSGRK